jgi:hypothetical protein
VDAATQGYRAAICANLDICGVSLSAADACFFDVSLTSPTLTTGFTLIVHVLYTDERSDSVVGCFALIVIRNLACESETTICRSYRDQLMRNQSVPAQGITGGSGQVGVGSLICGPAI